MLKRGRGVFGKKGGGQKQNDTEEDLKNGEIRTNLKMYKPLAKNLNLTVDHCLHKCL